MCTMTIMYTTFFFLKQGCILQVETLTLGNTGDDVILESTRLLSFNF
jgi:hypothetical protein